MFVSLGRLRAQTLCTLIFGSAFVNCWFCLEEEGGGGHSLRLGTMGLVFI